MKTISLLRNCLLAYAVLFGLSAQAGVIDFEDVGQVSIGSRFFSSGFDIGMHSMGGQIGRLGNYCTPRCPENGGQYALMTFGNFSAGQGMQAPWLDIRRADGAAFNLSGFDGSGAYNTNLGDHPGGEMPTRFIVTGVLATGGTVSQVLQFDNSLQHEGSLQFVSYKLGAEFSNLVSATFAAGGARSPDWDLLSIDNIVYSGVSAVPEPDQCALLLTGLLLLGGVAARRRHAS